MCCKLFKEGQYKLARTGEEIKKLAPLEGRLSYIYRIKYPKSSEENIALVKDKKGLDLLFYKFLLYKYFLKNDKPVLITEGKTDVAYLKCAFKYFAKKNQFNRLIALKENGQGYTYHFHVIVSGGNL